MSTSRLPFLLGALSAIGLATTLGSLLAFAWETYLWGSGNQDWGMPPHLLESQFADTLAGVIVAVAAGALGGTIYARLSPSGTLSRALLLGALVAVVMSLHLLIPRYPAEAHSFVGPLATVAASAIGFRLWRMRRS